MHERLGSAAARASDRDSQEELDSLLDVRSTGSSNSKMLLPVTALRRKAKDERKDVDVDDEDKGKPGSGRRSSVADWLKCRRLKTTVLLARWKGVLLLLLLLLLLVLVIEAQGLDRTTRGKAVSSVRIGPERDPGVGR
ncbi:unnamed protein product [Hyaloperonospora brassicae]|uniref:RxLR effector candidate protein n=1 Tax=Hyaloperonospora brassicae TaxID=162125 RepID=A0AAV0TE50_HYABA|nr:unnamed protein product [Hyaloperonospora brassicae]